MFPNNLEKHTRRPARTHTFLFSPFHWPSSRPPHAHDAPTDPRQLFPDGLYPTSISPLAPDRLDATHKLEDAASDTKVHCLAGHEADRVLSIAARAPQDTHQTRKAVGVVDRLGREDKIVWTAHARKVKCVPGTRKEAEVDVMGLEGRVERGEQLRGDVEF